MQTMGYRGDGTQQIEEVVKEIFPNSNVGRMDWDTTRGKWAFDKIINSINEFNSNPGEIVSFSKSNFSLQNANLLYSNIYNKVLNNE